MTTTRSHRKERAAAELVRIAQDALAVALNEVLPAAHPARKHMKASWETLLLARDKLRCKRGEEADGT